MRKIRIGNDFALLWKIRRGEQAEDLTEAQEMSLKLWVQGDHNSLKENIPFDIVGSDTVRVEVTPSIADKIGRYRLEFKYQFVNLSNADKNQKCAVDVEPFYIVPLTEIAETIDTVNCESDVLIGLRGRAFVYEDFTPEQIADLKQPAIDAGLIAKGQGDYAQQQGDYAKTQGARAENATDNIDISFNAWETQEADRVASEVIRESNESNRVDAEGIRVTNEIDRKSKESDRVSNESDRKLSETERRSSEIDRNNAEIIRESNEDLRKSNEIGRVGAESDRVSAETIREQQEAERQTNTATAITNAENAITDVNAAKDDYYDVVKPAIQAQGVYAQEQGDYAKSQGDYAKAQGELINESFATFYGVERSRDVADPSFGKIGNLLMHESLPIHNLIRGCKAGRDRKIVNFLDRNTWLLNADGTPSVLDGSDGLDVLNYYPDMYAILDGGTDTEIWAISTIPFSYKGIEAIHIKSHLVAPDYCTVDRTTNESRCVASDDANLAGSGSGATAGGVGYPRTYTSRYNYEVYAENKGEKWNGWIYRDYLTLQAFMYIQYKTRNLKQFFPGIGQGWSGANWSAYNGYYPVIKILEAHKNISGNNMTGIYTKKFNFDVDGAPVEYNTGFGVYRGMILWGHLWKWISGIDFEVQSEEEGGKSNVYVQFNPDKIDKNRSDSSFEFMNNYQLMGQASRSNGWARTTIPFAAQPDTVGGGETTFGCFYFWQNPPATGTIRRGVCFGAFLNYGARCALGTATSHNGGSYANANLGGGFRADENKGG